MLTLAEKSNDIIKYNYASDTVIRGAFSVLFQHQLWTQTASNRSQLDTDCKMKAAGEFENLELQ